ncbi:hypothetical protein [Bradyrhizobium sp. LMTR 3]|uniref:hypothetical protein n=1 Tax=Bradyrhizobium sp. LMTR 3 TaxID=189873 RepID=UPI000810C691|nr:hypothetical protein [Bradyrhizobium sp. LMTR 3]OCK59853.1 hypothetical protein LMTR3_19730 [Bradyrhizobium sp. LMTR 3]
MTKILNVNDLCDAIVGSMLDASRSASWNICGRRSEGSGGPFTGVFSEQAEYEGGFGETCVNFRLAYAG